MIPHMEILHFVQENSYFIQILLSLTSVQAVYFPTRWSYDLRMQVSILCPYFPHTSIATDIPCYVSNYIALVTCNHVH